jgi:hypothetical protein
VSDAPAGRADEQPVSSAVTARGARVLAMEIGPGPGETLDAAVATAKAAGVTTAVLNYNWSDLEPAAFQYQNARLISTLTTGPATLSTDHFLRLTWAPVAGATQYKVMRLASGGTPAQTGLIATTTATTFDDIGLGVPTFSFQEFLRTLGYRTHTTPSTAKLGFTQLATEAHARNW